MTPRQVVAVAMSGGVDSSIAAALLQQQGHEVMGFTMKITGLGADLTEESEDGFSTTIDDARQVAAKLQIPHYVFDCKEIFSREVVDEFCREYSYGRTPNPCIRCNMKLKFGYLLEKVLALGATYMATGHYARLRYDPGRDRFMLLAAKDKQKDQSYALYGLNQHQLSHIIFPLGGLTKKETRALAERLGLKVAQKKDSQEICFVPDNDYRAFLEQRIPAAIRPGLFIDATGRVLGKHRGLPFYTVGQRRGLGISSAERLYVTDMNQTDNTITLGPEQDLWYSQIRAEKVNWVSIPPPAKPKEARVRVRYRGVLYRAQLVPEGQAAVTIKFHQEARAPAPGQAAVFYGAEDEVLGGGTIVK